MKWCWNVVEILLNYSFANDEQTRASILEWNWSTKGNTKRCRWNPPKIISGKQRIELTVLIYILWMHLMNLLAKSPPAAANLCWKLDTHFIQQLFRCQMELLKKTQKSAKLNSMCFNGYYKNNPMNRDLNHFFVLSNWVVCRHFGLFVRILGCLLKFWFVFHLPI